MRRGARWHGALAAAVWVGSAPEGGSPAGQCGVIQSVPVCLADTWVPVGTLLCALERPLSFAVGREERWVGSPGRAGGCRPVPRRSSRRGLVWGCRLTPGFLCSPQAKEEPRADERVRVPPRDHRRSRDGGRVRDLQLEHVQLRLLLRGQQLGCSRRARVAGPRRAANASSGCAEHPRLAAGTPGSAADSSRKAVAEERVLAELHSWV